MNAVSWLAMPNSSAPLNFEPHDGTASPSPPSTRNKPAAESPPDFTTVFAKEVEIIADRRKVVGLEAAALLEASAAPGGARPAAGLGLIGLSLSGGGIRSASFSLGVLQAFEHAKWIRHLDYLSTVSGGGFTGSTLSSALHHARLDGTPFAFSQSATADAAIVTHLRNQSSYLTPGGFLDTVRLPAMVVRGFALNVLALLPWLFLAALATEFYYALAYNNPNAFRYIVDFVPMLVGGVPFALLMLASPFVPRLERRASRWRDRYEKAFAASLVLLVLGVSSHFVLLIVNFAVEHPKETKRLLATATTYWLGLFGVLLVIYQIVAVKNATRARLLRRILLGGTGLLVPLALFSAYVVFSIHLTPVPYYRDTPSGVSAELVDALQTLAKSAPLAGETSELPVGVRRWLEQQGLDPEQGTLAVAAPQSDSAPAPVTTDGTGQECIDIVQDCNQLERCDTCDFARQCCWTFRDTQTDATLELSLWGHGETSLRTKAGQVSLSIGRIPWSSLALPKLAMQLDSVSDFIGRMYSEDERAMWRRYPFDRECWIVSVALGLSVLAFLVGLVSDANGLSLHGFYRDRLARAFVVRGRPGASNNFDSASRLLLSDLTPERSGAPYPLLNATLNVSGGLESALRFRRGSAFVFSPQFIGSQATGYIATKAMEAADSDFTLASATAISAAAAGPNMGSFTSGSLSPLFALLNLRLGYWLRHPQRAASKWLLLRKPGNRHILREALGLIDDRGAFVNVSDGGHFENLGAYELLRRKCRLIIVVDSEEDRLGQLKGLTTLMRLARIDFGAMITADLGAFAPRHDKAAQPWLWATIRYGSLPDGTEEVGYLLYIKANMVAGAPHYVDAYRTQSPDFPHESTADQFFNEVQFECYRALGYHLGTMVTQDEALRAQITNLLESTDVRGGRASDGCPDAPQGQIS